MAITLLDKDCVLDLFDLMDTTSSTDPIGLYKWQRGHPDLLSCSKEVQTSSNLPTKTFTRRYGCAEKGIRWLVCYIFVDVCITVGLVKDNG